MTWVLNTQRLTLREFSLDDVAFIVELVNSPGWLQFIGDRGISTLEDAQQYLLNGPIASYTANGFGLWCVCQYDNELPIGMCGLLKREDLDHMDLGFAFLPKYTGQGFATESAMGTLQYAYERLGAKTLLAITVPENTRSIQLLERIGFRYERVCRVRGEDLQLFTHTGR